MPVKMAGYRPQNCWNFQVQAATEKAIFFYLHDLSFYLLDHLSS